MSSILPRSPSAGSALTGRSEAIRPPGRHFVNGGPMTPPWPPGSEVGIFGMGCFWGAERLFWKLPGVISTQVGYAAGFTPHPTYEEVCTGQTGHAEVVRVVFDPAVTSYQALLQTFWENHDPTQGMRQGNDIGTQYRSIVLATTEAQRAAAQAGRDSYGAQLQAGGYPAPTTSIEDAGEFYFAEDYHQQYLAKNPGGYCGIGGTGILCTA